MTTHFFTIVLDGMPFVSLIYPELRKLKFPWRWWVVEGVALPEGDTRWVSPTVPRLSNDYTYDYVESIARYDSRISHIVKLSWNGKVAMCNAPLLQIKDSDFLLWQIDSDEIWTAEQLALGRELMLQDGDRNCAYFKCRYFVGPRLAITRGNYGNRSDFEWRRLWKLKRGARFATHEPPVIEGFEARPWEHNTTASIGLTFDHFALATEAQVAFKEAYYGSANNKATGHLYKKAVEGWRKLQQAPTPVAQVGQYLPWVGAGIVADKV